MKYKCFDCLAEFDKLQDHIGSTLVDLIMSGCPYCKSTNINYTKQHMLKIERKLKIAKLNKERKTKINKINNLNE